MQRSIRGATTVIRDTRENVIDAVKELLLEMLQANDVNAENIVNIMFTVTGDIRSVFPAVAAREIGLVDVPLIDCQQMECENSLKFCVRVMLTYNTDKELNDVKHVYLRGAEVLRPDLIKR